MASVVIYIVVILFFFSYIAYILYRPFYERSLHFRKKTKGIWVVSPDGSYQKRMTVGSEGYNRNEIMCGNMILNSPTNNFVYENHAAYKEHELYSVGKSVLFDFFHMKKDGDSLNYRISHSYVVDGQFYFDLEYDGSEELGVLFKKVVGISSDYFVCK